VQESKPVAAFIVAQSQSDQPLPITRAFRRATTLSLSRQKILEIGSLRGREKGEPLE
jgi:hypothetical protein